MCGFNLIQSNIQTKKIVESVTPKKGTAVLFNGHILHAGGIPKKHSRCIVNYNIL